jgi:hypothetical protein
MKVIKNKATKIATNNLQAVPKGIVMIINAVNHKVKF